MESKVERSGIRTVPTTDVPVSGRSSVSPKTKAIGTGPSRERRTASSLRSKGEVADRVTASSGFRHNSRDVGGNASPKRRQRGEAECNFLPAQALHLLEREIRQLLITPPKSGEPSAFGKVGRAAIRTIPGASDYAAPVAVVMVSSPCALGPVSRCRNSKAKNSARNPRIEKIHMPKA